MSLCFRYIKIKVQQLAKKERGTDECNDLTIKLSNNTNDINYQIISTKKNAFKLHDEIILDIGKMSDVSSISIMSTATSYGSSAVDKVNIFIAEKLDEWSMLYKDLIINSSGDGYYAKYSKKIKIDALYFEKYFLLQQINTKHIFSINNNEMVDLNQQVIGKQLYLEKGFNNVRDINNLKNINLNDFKLMMYMDTNININKVSIACQIEPYRPIDALKTINDGTFDVLVKELEN
ncbi:hypothetical protein ADU80_00530 (plasmid) [Clostridium botulinum]|uniref:Uncharacterized protein n=1 Tax=Clostridium botulinum TaxID=1491 RepID=A0A9Q1UXD6_CLOBO|nr:hypothetical protein [Clostridium botulinum]AEB77317.1 hypothetical protein CbC4_4117 [Clostridium botulinum BKT015925]KEH96309.1 hypothetical protein Y848_13575 [Clostridium botulinum C/D str. Sp77]KLU74410.1 hypothetical protein CBC3_p0114 [Clostridium botulinum V891]KOA73871.1 hypothetical protein ADU78_11555 [Clostridium botulinum]KOA79560.1 hypothetical protein ADU77_04055 [Clostridium botulinum]